MRQLFFSLLALFCFSPIFGAKKIVNIADGDLYSAVYTPADGCFKSSDGWGGCMLDISGDLSDYTALVFNFSKSDAQFRILITYGTGEQEHKDYYQAASASGGSKFIDLTNTSNIPSLKNIQSIKLEAESSGSITFSEVYLQCVDKPSTYESSLNVISDTTVKYQYVRGFGAMNDWGGSLSESIVATAYGNGDNQLGLNIMRVRISPVKSEWANLLTSVKKAKSLGAIVFATPWTPPANMKSSGNINGGDSYLLASSYSDYADYLNEFVNYMKSNDADIYAISVQNESDFKAEYEGCYWTADQMYDFVKNYADKIDCKFIAPESFCFNHAMSDKILNDDIACNNLEIIGGHLYGVTSIADYQLAAQKNKEVWMTEYLTNSNKDYTITWDDNIDYCRLISQCLDKGYNAYIWWYLKRYYGLIGDGEQNTTLGAVSKRGKLMSQYAKNLTGATRTKCTVPDGVSDDLIISSYVKNGNIIYMILNKSQITFNDVAFSLPSKPLSVKAIVSDEILDRKDYSVTSSDTLIKCKIAPQCLITITAIFNNSDSATGDVSIDKSEINNFVLCPNPALDNITLNGITEGGKVEIYSISGRKIMSLISTGKSFTIDISHLDTGVYLVKTEGGTKKFVKE